jgi:plastocyanin
MKFQPAELSVHQGDTVFWINRDIVAHDVTEKDKTWASPLLNAGDSWEKVVTKSDAYYCSIHITMKGELKVN